MATYKSQYLMEVQAADKSKAVLTNLQNNLKKTAKDGAGGAKSVTEGWKLAVGAFIAVKAAAAGISAIFSSLKAGRDAAMVDSAFKSIHGSADRLLVKLREASQYAIDDTSLQALANRLAMAGGDMEQFAKVLPVAYQAAAATGQDYLQVAEQITKAVASGRKMSLEAFVGILDEVTAYDKYAESVNKSVSALTAFDKKQAMVQAGLQALQDKYGHIKIDVDAAKIDNLKKDWDDFVSNVQVGILRTAGQLADVVKGIGEEGRREGLMLRTLIDEAARGFTAGIGAPVLSAEFQDTYKELWIVTDAFQKLSGRVAEGDTTVKTMLDTLRDAGRISEETYQKLNTAQEQAKAHGLDELQTLTVLARLSGEVAEKRKAVIEQDARARRESLEAIAAERKAVENAAKNEIKGRAETLKAAQDYQSLMVSKGELESKSIKTLTDLERLKLQVINDQLVALAGVSELAQRSAKQALQNWVNEWQMAIAKVKGMTGEDWAKLLAKVKPVKPVKPVKSPGPGTKPPTETEAVISAADWARHQLDMERKGLSAREVLQREHFIKVMELEDQYKGIHLQAALKMRRGELALELEAVGEAKQKELSEANSARQVAAQEHALAMAKLSGKETDDELRKRQRDIGLMKLSHAQALGEEGNFQLEKARLIELFEAETLAAREQREKEARQKRFDGIVSDLSTMGQLFTAVSMVGDDQDNPMVRAIGGIGVAASQASVALKQYEGNTAATMLGVAGAAAAGAASFVKSEKAKAFILAGMEGAHALASLAMGNPIMAGIHSAAAAAYGLIGAFTGGGASQKPMTHYRAPAAATATSAGQAGGNTYQFFVEGIVAGRDRDFARAVVGLLNDAKGLVYLDQKLVTSNAGSF